MAFFSLFFLLPLSYLLLFLLLRCRKQLIAGRTNLPPSPPRLPLIGNLHQLGPLLHQSLAALSSRHGPLMLLHLGRVPTLVVSSPDAACDVLRHQDLVCAGRPVITPAKILADGDMAFAPYGDYWRQLRKICSVHLLSSKRVQSYRRAREEEVAAMVAAIAAQASTTINLSVIIYSFANNMLCRVVSGKIKRTEGRNRVFAELIDENSMLLMAVYLGDYFRWLGWVDGFLGYVARARKIRKRWEELLDQVIKEHADRADHDENWKEEQEEKEKDFVDVLMSLQDKNEFILEPANLKSLLVDVFGAGTDTSYITLEWAMVELVRNPLAMQKLQDEVKSIASRKSLVKEEDLHQMTYLLAVIKEVLRLHPPVPLLLPRETLNDCTIQGYSIPKKTRILVNAWAIGRDPKQWDAPEAFRPERFLDGTVVDFNGTDFRYIPFGSGRRVCPGLQFAIASLELALANLVHQFDWKLPDGMEKEEFHTRESPGIVVQREGQLHLVAKPWSECLEE